MNEKIQKLEINIIYMNLRLEILEERDSIREVNSKGVVIEEACKAAYNTTGKLESNKIRM